MKMMMMRKRKRAVERTPRRMFWLFHAFHGGKAPEAGFWGEKK
jgi:hypothetical protein